MSEMNLDKLPKYAREEIVALRRQVDELRRSLIEQRQDVPSRVEWGKSWSVDAARGFLPSDTEVSFVVSVKPDQRIRVRLTKDGLYVNGDCSLQILCESSNCFTIQERPR